MTNDLMFAMAAGINAHNQTARESTKAGTVTLTDYCGNVFVLHVWVKPDLELHYLMATGNGYPSSVSNMFRANLPTAADAFDTPAELFEAITHTTHVAAEVTYEMSQASHDIQADLDAELD